MKILLYVHIYTFDDILYMSNYLQITFPVVGRRPQGTLQGYFASAGSLARIIYPIMSGYIISYDSINTVMVVLFVNLMLVNTFVAINSKTLEALAV